MKSTEMPCFEGNESAEMIHSLVIRPNIGDKVFLQYSSDGFVWGLFLVSLSEKSVTRFWETKQDLCRWELRLYSYLLLRRNNSKLLMKLQSLPCGSASKENTLIAPVWLTCLGSPMLVGGPGPGIRVCVPGGGAGGFVGGSRAESPQVNKFEHVHRCSVITWSSLLRGQNDWQNDRQTDTTKKITSPQLRWWDVKM